MIVVTMELWPGGDKSRSRTLGIIGITNDGTGDKGEGNYDVVASHAGIFFGKREEPFKRGKVRGFIRSLSPYRLLARALAAIKET